LLGVPVNILRGADPLTSLLYPNEYLVLLRLWSACPGLYYGPGVALYFLGSLENYKYYSEKV